MQALKHLPVYRRITQETKVTETEGSHITALIAQEGQEQEMKYPHENHGKSVHLPVCKYQ